MPLGIKPRPQPNEARSPNPETGDSFLNGISGEQQGRVPRHRKLSPFSTQADAP